MHAVCKSVDRAIMCLRVTPVSPHCLAPSSVSPHPVLVLDPALMRLVSPPCSNHRLPAMFRLCYIYVLWIADANIMKVCCKVTPSIIYLATLWLMPIFLSASHFFPYIPTGKTKPCPNCRQTIDCFCCCLFVCLFVSALVCLFFTFPSPPCI